MPKMLAMPVGNTQIEKAKDEHDMTIGVSIRLLVLPEDFDSLPEMLCEAAHQVYAAPREKE